MGNLTIMDVSNIVGIVCSGQPMLDQPRRQSCRPHRDIILRSFLGECCDHAGPDLSQQEAASNSFGLLCRLFRISCVHTRVERGFALYGRGIARQIQCVRFYNFLRACDIAI